MTGRRSARCAASSTRQWPRTGQPPAWTTHHIRELIPWVDAHLPAIPDRSGRAVAGLSMGGFGAMTYATRFPDLFAAAESFSGALNPIYGYPYGIPDRRERGVHRPRLRPVHLGGVHDAEGPLPKGGHHWAYWQRGVRMFLPIMAEAFTQVLQAPASFSYRSAEPTFTAWDWRFAGET